MEVKDKILKCFGLYQAAKIIFKLKNQNYIS
jgi:hypothetical protein